MRSIYKNMYHNLIRTHLSVPKEGVGTSFLPRRSWTLLSRGRTLMLSDFLMTYPFVFPHVTSESGTVVFKLWFFTRRSQTAGELYHQRWNSGIPKVDTKR